MPDTELLYQIALTLTPQIGSVHAKSLINIYGTAAAVYKAKKRELEQIEGIGTVRASCIKSFTNFTLCEQEAAFIEKYKIQPLFITNKNYPQRLLNCYDCPPLLYYRGTASLNSTKIIAIVGTRAHSEYGRAVCEKFVADLKEENIVIVSGLAFGIDTIAHKTALKYNIPTVGVMAHGLDRIYPTQNKALAKQMANAGGLLTEFMSYTNPDKQNFPKRNRIVAGICDAVIVIETGKKGGSLITAELGNNYNKDVFALPGRVSDTGSEGCHYLIKNNKAALITSAADMLDMMNWKLKGKPALKKQRELFITLSPDEQVIVEILKQQEAVHIDQIYNKSGLSSSTIATVLLMLEMQSIISSLPGKMYKLL